MGDKTNESSKTDAADGERETLGTPWWRRALADAHQPTSRREALGALLAAGGALAGLALVLEGCDPWIPPSDPVEPRVEEPPSRVERRPTLALQKERGWSFGAEFDELTFDGEVELPFSRGDIARLPLELRPQRTDLAPYYVPTLFQSPSAAPTSVLQSDPQLVPPLADVLQPIYTDEMRAAYRRGMRVAQLLWDVPDVALIIDLPGPEAVAFAAGAVSGFDAVFTFDNWPHPCFVVPAHLTLAAALYFQPLFAKASASSDRHRPAFVLDRRRLAPYEDSAGDFDNRYVARLPGAEAMLALGAHRVLYVSPDGDDPYEMDDLNDDFVAYADEGVDVRMLAASRLHPEIGVPDDEGGAPCYYLGSALLEAQFWADYPWRSPAPQGHGPGSFTHAPGAYAPAARFTSFSGAPATGEPGAHRVPEDFGTVAVRVATATGAIIRPVIQRSGSWTRATGSGSGG